MKSSPPEWIDLCKPCKKGVCDYIKELVEKGVVDTVKDATDLMSREVDGEWKAETLRKIYYRDKRRGTSVPRMDDDESFEMLRWAYGSLVEAHENLGTVVMHIFRAGYELDDLVAVVRKCKRHIDSIVRELKKVQANGLSA